MKIGYLGAGTWGFALTFLLASNGHKVTLWTSRPEFASQLKQTRAHPKLPHFQLDESVVFTSDLSETLEGADCLVESVTSAGLRPVLEKVKAAQELTCPLVITSKGIEQDTGLLLPEVALDVFGSTYRDKIGCLSGPSHAEEVIKKLPTSVVCAAYDKDLMFMVRDLFSSLFFRVYPNADLSGVAFG